MNVIGKDEEIFNYLSSNKLYILSSILNKIDIFSDEFAVTIELHFKLSPKNKVFKIKFIDVIEYSFYYNSKHGFYNVESCKFFKLEEGFYISLDPYDETKEIDQNDQDFILCIGIEGYVE